MSAPMEKTEVMDHQLQTYFTTAVEVARTAGQVKHFPNVFRNRFNVLYGCKLAVKIDKATT